MYSLSFRDACHHLLSPCRQQGVKNKAAETLPASRTLVCSPNCERVCCRHETPTWSGKRRDQHAASPALCRWLVCSFLSCVMRSLRYLPFSVLVAFAHQFQKQVHWARRLPSAVIAGEMPGTATERFVLLACRLLPQEMLVTSCGCRGVHSEEDLLQRSW